MGEYVENQGHVVVSPAGILDLPFFLAFGLIDYLLFLPLQTCFNFQQTGLQRLSSQFGQLTNLLSNTSILPAAGFLIRTQCLRQFGLDVGAEEHELLAFLVHLFDLVADDCE